MEELASIPPPGGAGGVAWVVGMAAVALAMGRRPSWAAGLAVVAALAAAVGVLLPTGPVDSVGQASLLWIQRSGAVCHGAAASAIALWAAMLSARAGKPDVWISVATSAAVGLSLGLGAAVGAPSGAGVVAAMLTVGVVLTAPERGARVATVVVIGSLWLAADLATQARAYRLLLSGDLVSAQSDIAAAWQAVFGVRVAMSGAVVAAVLSRVLGRVPTPASNRWFWLAPLGVAAALAGSSLSLQQVRDQANSVALLGPERLPALPTAALPEASCVEWPAGLGWGRAERFAGGCGTSATVAVRADAREPASSLLQLGPDVEVLVRRTERVPLEPPLRQLAVGAVPMLVADEPVPSRFESDLGVTGQLDAWLDERLGRPAALVPGHLWLIDSPRGSMLLLRGTGISVAGKAQRREVFRRLLKGTESPALALVVGARWTVEDVALMCAEARAIHATGDVTCVLTPRLADPELRGRTAPRTPTE